MILILVRFIKIYEQVMMSYKIKELNIVGIEHSFWRKNLLPNLCIFSPKSDWEHTTLGRVRRQPLSPKFFYRLQLKYSRTMHFITIIIFLDIKLLKEQP